MKIAQWQSHLQLLHVNPQYWSWQGSRVHSFKSLYMGSKHVQHQLAQTTFVLSRFLLLSSLSHPPLSLSLFLLGLGYSNDMCIYVLVSYIMARSDVAGLLTREPRVYKLQHQHRYYN